jgi:hypothetical protein
MKILAAKNEDHSALRLSFRCADKCAPTRQHRVIPEKGFSVGRSLKQCGETNKNRLVAGYEAVRQPEARF